MNYSTVTAIMIALFGQFAVTPIAEARDIHSFACRAYSEILDGPSGSIQVDPKSELDSAFIYRIVIDEAYPTAAGVVQVGQLEKIHARTFAPVNSCASIIDDSRSVLDGRLPAGSKRWNFQCGWIKQEAFAVATSLDLPYEQNQLIGVVREKEKDFLWFDCKYSVVPSAN
ncbi:MAG: hypothetical protein EOP09_06090 [Proteobacteria bacterium]|nr:MAG: hypothetical protein EOP09_06090 [Pseudomonadota bacterium]